MSLANRVALAWGLLLVPVVIFYILKIRLKRVPVSTVLFCALAHQLHQLSIQM